MVGALSFRYPIIYESFNEQVEATVNFDITEKLNQINHQVLVLPAQDDRLFSVDDSWNSLKRISNAQLRVIAKAGHSIHIEQAQSVLNEVINFLG